jgi:hypothetical protein
LLIFDRRAKGILGATSVDNPKSWLERNYSIYRQATPSFLYSVETIDMKFEDNWYQILNSEYSKPVGGSNTKTSNIPKE